MVRQNI
jgi:hypothetical protein